MRESRPVSAARRGRRSARRRRRTCRSVAATRSGAWRHGDQCRAGGGEGRAPATGETRRRHRRTSAAVCRGREASAGRPRLRQPAPRADGVSRAAAGDPARRRRLRRQHHRRRARVSMSNTSPPTPRGRCMSDIAAARSWATRWPTCWPRPATTSPRNTTSTTPARRSTALAWAAYWRYLQAIGTPLDAKQDFARARFRGGSAISRRLPGPGRRSAGRRVRRRRWRTPDGGIAAPDVWLDTVRDFTVAAMMDAIREDLALARRGAGCLQSPNARLVDSGAVDASRMVANAD